MSVSDRDVTEGENLHVLLTHLTPAGAARGLTADRAAEILRPIRPREPALQTLRGLAVDLVAEIRQLDRRIAKAARDIEAAVESSGSTLTELCGIGTLNAAKILGRVGSVHRFRSAAAFASYTGTAPIEASSGDVTRHRLSRAGDRQLNCCLHANGDHPNRPRHPRAGLLPTKTSRRQEPPRSVALSQTTPLRRCLPPTPARRGDTSGGRPGGTHGGDSSVQRGRLTPLHQHFGPVTHRAGQPPPYNRRPKRLTQRGAVYSRRCRSDVALTVLVIVGGPCRGARPHAGRQSMMGCCGVDPHRSVAVGGPADENPAGCRRGVPGRACAGQRSAGEAVDDGVAR